MSTLSPRSPYSDGELLELFPPGLQLQQVQIVGHPSIGRHETLAKEQQLMRHGERTPVGPRFEKSGVPPTWTYCEAAERMLDVVKVGGAWEALGWRRRVEVLADGDVPVIAKGHTGTEFGACMDGQLTDKGRDTTFALGQRLGHLYIDQLGFMPRVMDSPGQIQIRSTVITRAQESVQQAYAGMYPASNRQYPPTIVTRKQTEQTLAPNDSKCKRFAELSAEYSKRAAKRWNDTPEMAYLQKMLNKYMFKEAKNDNKGILVDSHPRASGVLDHINTTLAHGPATKLPVDFYDPTVIKYLDKIVTDEWFAGYQESTEYRRLGIGGLAGDVVSWMVEHVEGEAATTGSSVESTSATKAERPFKFAMSGAHDTTLAAFLASFGAFDNRWPFYTSHIAIELFKNKKETDKEAQKDNNSITSAITSLLPSSLSSTTSIAHKDAGKVDPKDLERLKGYYVRLRYNDRPVTVPGCRAPGKHLEGNETFCTLEEFKRIADKFKPKDFVNECNMDLGKSAFPEKVVPPGFSS